MEAKHRQAAVTSVDEFLGYRRRIRWVSKAKRQLQIVFERERQIGRPVGVFFERQ